jgi:hypothetical protein
MTDVSDGKPEEDLGSAHTTGTGGLLLARWEPLVQAVELLLRFSERQLNHEVEVAFAAADASTAILRQIERDQVKLLRNQLRGVA